MTLQLTGRPADVQETGTFILEQQAQGWVVAAYERAAVPTPVPPTRDPNALTQAPVPTARGWSHEDAVAAAGRALDWINHYRQLNGVPAVAYAPNLQAAANEVARRFYETNRALSREEINSILDSFGASGAFPGYMTNGVPLPWGTCNTPPDQDPADLFRFVASTAWEVNAADLRLMAIGVWGPYEGVCGPSVTMVVVAAR